VPSIPWNEGLYFFNLSVEKGGLEVSTTFLFLSTFLKENNLIKIGFIFNTRYFAIVDNR
jgi:hypothetical protein